MFLSMEHWYRPDVIFSLAEIVCMRREDDAENREALCVQAETYRRRYGADIRFLHASPIKLSSSDVRRLIKVGKGLDEYLPAPVYAYIKEKGLYV